MEAKRAPNPSPSKKKVQEINHVSILVGSIVEKGFSSPSSVKPPQPSVLPFPVARHRSHGPHWYAVNAESKLNEDELLDEQENDADYGSISSVASPVKRKEKKGLDFSRWKELASVDGNKPQSKKPEEKAIVKKAVAQPKTQNKVTSKLKSETIVAKNEENTRNLAATSLSDSNGVGHSKREPELPASSGRELPTLMDEIEAENAARLSQMSTDEIVEAQAEIMEKMDPRLLDMLKKRGRSKSEGKKDARGKAEGEKKQKTQASVLDWERTGEATNSSWKFWSERVEKVRELRFALDGSIVEAHSTQEQLNGDKLDVDQYKVENVAERDFLRTEGDPAAAGYTIKEIVALIRSMVPGQRVLALQLLASILNKALYNLQGNCELGMLKINPTDQLIDWQAVWAFALGPEPQIALSLRIALDDNHDSVVLSCAKAIQCILSCDLNESFFSITEKVPVGTFLCTAPIFRSKPELDGGYLRGGFWKYNTKPSNMLPYDAEKIDDTNEEESSIQDDIVVAGQDVAAGFIRMGILPRICYLLEMDPLHALEECLLSVLISLARHSPTSASAIMRCPRLIETVVKMFTRSGTTEISAQIKAIVLLKVLSQSDKQICIDFVRRGTFQKAMWQWYRSAFTLEQWVERGKEYCKLTSNLMVEQLRLWRVCINYGYCIPYFEDFFPAMCLWLCLPTFDKLIEKQVLTEFTSITSEAYLILEALAQSLPILHSVDQLSEQAMHSSDDIMECWSWSQVLPMVNLAVHWLSLKNVPFVSSFVGCHRKSMDIFDTSASCIIWVISAVLHMLSSTFDRIAPAVTETKNFSRLPWIPEFVPKVGLEIIRNGFLNFGGLYDLKSTDCLDESCSLVGSLRYLREQSDREASLSSASCLHGLVRLASLIDCSVQRARSACDIQSFEGYNSETADKILEEGIIKWAKHDLAGVLADLMTLVQTEWHFVQSVEMFGRGGPAPGIGIGWGSSNGGFWSWDVLLAQIDSQLILQLFEVFPVVLEEEHKFAEGMDINTFAAGLNLSSTRINCVLAVCLTAGPQDRWTIQKALDQLLQAPVLKHLNLCIHSLLQCHSKFKTFEWQYEESDFNYFSEILNMHFKSRWISIKKKSSGKVDSGSNNHDAPRKGNVLETIQEEQEISETSNKFSDCNSLLIEWVHQRLPLPVNWFLSAMCTSLENKNASTCISVNVSDVAKGGLFLLLGLESMSYFHSSDSERSLVSGVSLVWKLHALSMTLHAGMDVLYDEKSKDIFETLQDLYGEHLDKLRCQGIREQLKTTDQSLVSLPKSPKAEESGSLYLLNFQTHIHEIYTTFIENLIEQFGAISYGDAIFGRQVAFYLHQCVEQPVRLAAWNALSNARLLELLPPFDKCFAEPEGYLMPVEADERILEAYTKSWVSGALDTAATRQSMSFSLALHHISCFIFKVDPSEKSSLRNKLARSILRSYSQKQHQEGMLLKAIKHGLPILQEALSTESARRVEVLKEACEGNSSLLVVVEKLKSIMTIDEVSHL